MNWWCYIVRCKDGSFYTGITNDLMKRIDRHNTGKASKYTRNKSVPNKIELNEK